MKVQSGTIKEKLEQREIDTLSEFAAKSRFTKGRRIDLESCPLRTEFQRDRDRILHSKAFRRLKHKTQVFFSPSDDHYRTRLTHTLEVSQIARTIAKALDLNEDLTEAIALGHDLGHTPFGHSGEDVLNRVVEGGFKHNEQSIRVVTHIEDLNLTEETLDGILYHSYGGDKKAFTLEGQTVKISDKIAYLHHDIQDTIRAGFITQDDLPKDCGEYFMAHKHSGIVSSMVANIVENSLGKKEISMSEECLHYYSELRNWMFANVYNNSRVKSEEDKAKHLIKELFEHYCCLLEQGFGSEDKLKIQRTASDYISGMTDRYALIKFEQIYMPAPFIKPQEDNFLLKLAQMNGL